MHFFEYFLVDINFIKNFYFKKKKFFAWPNIKAKRMIVPERIGNISPRKIAREVLFLFKNGFIIKSLLFILSIFHLLFFDTNNF